MRKLWILLILFIVVVGGGVLGGAYFWAKSKTSSSRVHFGEVTRGSITATVSAPGKVQSIETVNVSAEVPGRIVHLAVEEGDRVVKGDVLLRLDSQRYAESVEQSRASLSSARATKKLTEARLRKAQSDLNRLLGMGDSDLASKSEIERAETEAQVLEAELESRVEEIRRLEAAVRIAQNDLHKTHYKAPLDGVVIRVNVKEGENVVVGTMNNPGTVILTLADVSAMEVLAEVDETDVVRVAPGQETKIEVDAIPDTSFAGTVTNVGNSGRTRAEAVRFEIKARFLVPDPRLRSGMTADVTVNTETREEAVTVPIQALVARSRLKLSEDREQSEAGSKNPWKPAENLKGDALAEWNREIVEGVYKVEEGLAVFYEVHPGIDDKNRIEVLGSVLEAGDRVVTGPYRVLRTLEEGARVKEIKAKSGQ